MWSWVKTKRTRLHNTAHSLIPGFLCSHVLFPQHKAHLLIFPIFHSLNLFSHSLLPINYYLKIKFSLSFLSLKLLPVPLQPSIYHTVISFLIQSPCQCRTSTYCRSISSVSRSAFRLSFDSAYSRRPPYLHDGSLRRVEGVGLKGGSLVALLIGRANRVRPVGEQRRSRHPRHRPASAQIRLRAVRRLQSAVGAARRTARTQEQRVLQIGFRSIASST